MTYVKRGGRGSWVETYYPLFRPTFVDVQGRVFVVYTRSREAIRRLVRRFRSAPTVVDENTDNHEHFWFFDNDTIEGCRRNWVLAEAVRLAWSELLRRQFPGRTFELFVCNEYMISEDPDRPGVIVHEEVTPTLRLWTRAGAREEEIRNVYRVDQLGPKKVFWGEMHAEGLYDLESIFELIAAGPDHPLKQEALRVRTGWKSA